MKKSVTFFLLMLIASVMAAQSPQAFKYQAVARDGNGDPVINQDIAVKISILSGSETGPAVYSELHEIPTNQMGLFTLEIGNATFILSGNFSEIGWGYSTHFLKTEIDITGGSNYQLMGVSQLLSVPYALYANEAGNAENYTGGVGINVSNGVITNTAPDQNVTIAPGNGISTTGTYPNFMVTNTNPDQNVTLSSGYGITTSGTYPNFTITNAKPNATHTGDASGATELTVTGIQGRNVSNAAPTLNQVYKWDGTRWMPSTLDPYTAGTGINISSNVVTNTAPNATHTGDATGGSALTVEKIRGRTVSSTAPTTDQVLQWNGSQWTPTTLAAPSEDWSLTGNSGTSPTTNFIGTTDNTAFKIKVANQKAGWLDPYYASSTSFGYQALNVITTGQYNTAFGYNSLKANTTGNFNTASGHESLYSNTEGNGNTTTGDHSMFSNITGSYNTAVGFNTLRSNTEGSRNSAFGQASMYANTTGNYNVAFGYHTLNLNTEGYSNVAIGTRALYCNTIQSNLVAIGDSALYNNGTGATIYSAKFNTAVGSKALYSNTLASNNTAVGYEALYSNTSGSGNNAFGCKALDANSTGYDNVAIGENSLTNNTQGHHNNALGNYSLVANLTGNYNTANGYGSLIGNTAGEYNTAYGYQSGDYISTGDNNTAVGANALYNVNIGSNNTAIGTDAGYIGNAYSNTTCVGYQAGNTVIGGNKVAIGNTSVTWIGGQVNWSIFSDERIKENVKEDVAGLAFINRLRPVTYNLNIHRQNEMFKKDRKESSDWPGKYDIENIRMTGFIAQEVEKAALDAGYDFSGIEKPTEDGLYSLRYSDFVVPLVKAVQEQQVLIDHLQTTNEELRTKTDELQRQIDELKTLISGGVDH